MILASIVRTLTGKSRLRPGFFRAVPQVEQSVRTINPLNGQVQSERTEWRDATRSDALALWGMSMKERARAVVRLVPKSGRSTMTPPEAVGQEPNHGL